MSDSAFEALKIAIFTIIFMTALTAAFALMGTVNDMVEFTINGPTTSVNNNLIESLGATTVRTYRGKDILSLYGQSVNGELPENISIYIDVGIRYDLNTFVKEYLTVYMTSVFALEYEGDNNWVFIKQE